MSNTMNYDLEDRTATFGQTVIVLVSKIPHTIINNSLIDQLVRSATSVGANYMEADSASSKKDFRYKISICKKEAKESIHWLRMVAVANQKYRNECQLLCQEAHELVLIFSAILRHKPSA
ncbi:four helix bundle protein [Candidatus Falkowbacteria bacterium]|nr:four helix bundle protein [Candidatus Falkowbacteria bacterium]